MGLSLTILKFCIGCPVILNNWLKRINLVGGLWFVRMNALLIFLRDFLL